MIKFFIFLILLTSQISFGQSIAPGPYEATLPLFNEEKELGEIKVKIESEKIILVDKKSLLIALNSSLTSAIIQNLNRLPDEIKPELIAFPLKLNSELLRVECSIQLDQMEQVEIKVQDDLLIENKNALHPSSFGGAINSLLEQNWADERFGSNSFNGQFSSFLNAKTYVLENETFYQSQSNAKWFRGDTRIVKDFQKQEIRTQVGDIFPQIQGFMSGRAIGGINVHKNFSLNPYRLPYPKGVQEFTLKSRSLVKYFVNGVLVKTEYLGVGNYTARDIPLNNGLNTILIEATDDLGQKQVFVFKSASSIDLLNQSEARFDLSYGTPYVDNSLTRDYLEGEGNLFSGFFQYGLRSDLSASAYHQNQKDFNLLGSEIIHATAFGNLNFGLAKALQEGTDGQASSLSYQYVSQGAKWYQAHSLVMRYENRSKAFKNSLLDLTNLVQNNYAANYTLPISNLLTFSVGFNYGDVRDNSLSDRKGIDVNSNFRIFDHHNLSLFISRTKDEFEVWTDVVYFFLTISLPEKNSFVSTLYDQQQKSTRVTYLHDNRGILKTPRVQAIGENALEFKQAELDILYPTTVGEFGGRITGLQDRGSNDTFSRKSLRYNSALVFAKNDDQWGFGISRPVPGSFVIFKPSQGLKGQKIGLKSTSPFAEGESGLFDEIVFSNLLAYQYRGIQLDPTLLNDGYSLVKDNFILYPTYRSTHLISLEERGSVMLYGKLLNQKNIPLPLALGKLDGVPFFTNREGEFFVEGVDHGEHTLQIENIDQKHKIYIEKNERGYKNLGTIILKD